MTSNPYPSPPPPMAENMCPFSWESGSCWSDHNPEKLEVLQVLPALPEEMDLPVPCAPTGPVGNSRGLEEVVLPRGEARRLTLLYPIPFIPQALGVALPMGRPYRLCLRLQDHCLFPPSWKQWDP